MRSLPDRHVESARCVGRAAEHPAGVERQCNRAVGVDRNQAAVAVVEQSQRIGRCIGQRCFGKAHLRRDFVADRVANELLADAGAADRDGIVRRAGDAPLFAVRDDVIYAAPLDDVEWTLVAEAARRAGIRWVERPVGAAQLRLFDELFSFDCEGVSSIASFEGTPYLSLTAERIAAALAALPER